MNDAVIRYCAASAAGDIDGLMATLAPDIELISPLSGRMVFRGHDDLRLLLTGIYGSLTDLRWDDPIGQGFARVAISEGRIADLKLDAPWSSNWPTTVAFAAFALTCARGSP